jgi:pimeloyl-ACP methyl ester carboxylesterase
MNFAMARDLTTRREARQAGRTFDSRAPSERILRPMARARVGQQEIAWEEDGRGDPVLLLMGLGGDRHGWALVRPALAQRHRLVLVDNRDAGESAEAAGPYGLGDMATDALGVMDALGIERFHVVGASMGGAVAQHVALQAPTRVASLVLVSSWARTDALLAAILSTFRVMKERLSPAEFLAAIGPWAFTARYFQAPSPELAAFQAEVAARGGALQSVAAYQRQVDACLAHDLSGLLALLAMPALVLVGEDDILTPTRYARAVAAALGRGEVAVVPASGHACFLETPKPVAERVLRFLAHHPVAS